MLDDLREMESAVTGLQTKSDKIRALGRAGYTRRQIADFLGIRYQHVRNVLIDEERTKKSSDQNGAPSRQSGTSAAASDIGCATKATVGPGGTVRLPPGIVRAAGIGDGDVVFVRYEDDEIRISTPQAALRHAQKLVRKFVPADVSLAEELIRERRREAGRDASGP